MLTKLMNWEFGYWRWQINFYENHPMILHAINVILIIGLIVTIIWAIQSCIEIRKSNKEINEQEQNEI